MKLLPPEITAQLPYRFFKQNGTSEKLLDMVRATDGDTQVLFFVPLQSFCVNHPVASFP